MRTCGLPRIPRRGCVRNRPENGRIIRCRSAVCVPAFLCGVAFSFGIGLYCSGEAAFARRRGIYPRGTKPPGGSEKALPPAPPGCTRGYTAGAQLHMAMPHERVAGRLSRPVTPAKEKPTNIPQNGSRVEDPCRVKGHFVGASPQWGVRRRRKRRGMLDRPCPPEAPGFFTFPYPNRLQFPGNTGILNMIRQGRKTSPDPSVWVKRI